MKGKTARNTGFLVNSTIVQLIELDLFQAITNVNVSLIEINEIRNGKNERGVVYNWVTFEHGDKIELNKLNEILLQNIIMREIRHSDFISKVYTDVIMSADKRSEHIQTLERIIKCNKGLKDFVYQRTKDVIRNFDDIYNTSLSVIFSSELFNHTYNGITSQLLATETIAKTKRLVNKTGLLEYPSFKYNFQKRVIADWWIPLIREYYDSIS